MAKGKAPKPIKLTKVLAPYFNAVGAVIYCHGLLERDLESLLVMLTQSYYTPTVLNHVFSWEARIDVFSQMAQIRFRDKKTRTRIACLVAELSAVNGKRNDLVHGRWLGMDRVRGFQIQRLQPRKREPGKYRIEFCRPTDINALGRRIFALSKRVRQFYVYVQKRNALEAKNRNGFQ